MIGISAYLAGSAQSLAAFAQGLQVLPQNLLEHGNNDSDFTFYTREENGMLYATVTGDFAYMCDVDLFHVTREQIYAALQALSVQGLVIAVPDEESAAPTDFILFEAGVKRAVDVVIDDLTEEVRIRRAASGQV